jgi:hypothetical protein
MSGKKFKHCHLKTMPPLVSEKDAKTYQEAMDRAEQVYFAEGKDA